MNNLLTYYRARGFVQTLQFAKIKLRAAIAQNDLGWLFIYELNPFIATRQRDAYNRCAEETWTDLQSVQGLKTREYHFDVADYLAFVEKADYDAYGKYYRGGMSGNEAHRTERLPQHYLSIKLLEITQDDVYIDVASNTSPMKNIVRSLYGVDTYSLDIIYPPGIHGDTIGCDAGDTKLPSGFASKISLHCSFEHFAYGSDMNFIREGSRILRQKGKVCIIPFYILNEYCIWQDPTLETDLTLKDTERARVVQVRNCAAPYARYYHRESFKERILDNCGDLKPIMYRITNLADLRGEGCYSKFALVLEKP